MKLIPTSRARAMVRAESRSSVGPPNIMVPRQRGETLTPLRPSLRYSMYAASLQSFEVMPYAPQAAAHGVVAPGDTQVGEPGLAEHPRGRRVRHEGEGLQRLQTEPARVLDHREHALGRIALAPVRPAERIAELVHVA